MQLLVCRGIFLKGKCRFQYVDNIFLEVFRISVLFQCWMPGCKHYFLYVFFYFMVGVRQGSLIKFLLRSVWKYRNLVL